jgi:hypothetical protein
MPDDQRDGSDRRTANLQAIWRNVIILMVITGAGFIALISILYFMHDAVIVDLGYRHFATIFGLPAAAAAALLVVLVTRAVSGPMSVEFLGLKFHGAASEALMWVLCFLAIAYAVGSTWKLEYVQGGG